MSERGTERFKPKRSFKKPKGKPSVAGESRLSAIEDTPVKRPATTEHVTRQRDTHKVCSPRREPADVQSPHPTSPTSEVWEATRPLQTAPSSPADVKSPHIPPQSREDRKMTTDNSTFLGAKPSTRSPLPPTRDKVAPTQARDGERSFAKFPAHPKNYPQDRYQHRHAEPSSRRYHESHQQGALPPTSSWEQGQPRPRGPPPAAPHRNLSMPIKYIGRPPPRPTQNRDCNNTEVVRPRPWGQAPETGSEEDDGGWGHNYTVSRWISNLPVGPPSSAPSQVNDCVSSDDHSVAPSQARSAAPSRPDSAPPIHAPVTVFYSDDEEPAPHGRQNPSSTEGDESSPSEGEASNEASDEAPIARSVTDKKAVSADQARVATARDQDERRHGPAPPSRGRLRSEGSRLTSFKMSKPFPDPPKKLPFGLVHNPDKFWKRDPHPTTSPIFASRRLYVRAPFSIRTAEFRELAVNHFARYGTIRCIIPNRHFDGKGDAVFVIYEEESSVQKVLEDPYSSRGIYKSTSRSTFIEITFNIKTVPAEMQLRALWVNITGPRHDSRTRSASPRGFEVPGDEDRESLERQPLPPSLSVWAIPFLTQSGRTVMRVHLSGPGVNNEHFEQARLQAFEAGGEAKLVKEFDLGRRVHEKEFLPDLIDCFCDIHETIKPTKDSKGWIFLVSPSREAEFLLHKLRTIPGVSARYAVESDGEGRYRAPVPRHGQWAEDATSTPTEEDVAEAEANVPHSPLVQTPTWSTPTRTILDTGVKTPSPSSPDFIHPQLRAQVLPTYKGRILREEYVDGEPKYFDDAAIFVGRLVKKQETHLSLLKRFERYGKIVTIEYNPGSTQTTYATARVLFQTAEAAWSAIQYEDGAVSFGSAIKVELRKVLPMDVQVRKMFVDPIGRAMSPTMATQYSPPSPEVSCTPPAAPTPPSARTPPALAPINPASMPFHLPWMQPQTGAPMPQAYDPTMMPWFPPQFMFPGNMTHGSVNPSQVAHAPAIYPMFFPFPIGFNLGPHQPQRQTPLSMPPTSAPPEPVAAEPSVGSLSTAPIHEPATEPPEKPSETKPTISIPVPDGNHPRVLGTKFEDGLLKPIYDADELKRWREANGIQEDNTGGVGLPADVPPSAPPQSTSSAPAKIEQLPLLPLSSGGHDNHTPLSFNVTVTPPSIQTNPTGEPIATAPHPSSHSVSESSPRRFDDAQNPSGRGVSGQGPGDLGGGASGIPDRSQSETGRFSGPPNQSPMPPGGWGRRDYSGPPRDYGGARYPYSGGPVTNSGWPQRSGPPQHSGRGNDRWASQALPYPAAEAVPLNEEDTGGW